MPYICSLLPGMWLLTQMLTVVHPGSFVECPTGAGLECTIQGKGCLLALNST